jgi:hypothetical protein
MFISYYVFGVFSRAWGLCAPLRFKPYSNIECGEMRATECVWLVPGTEGEAA